MRQRRGVKSGGRESVWKDMIHGESENERRWRKEGLKGVKQKIEEGEFCWVHRSDVV